MAELIVKATYKNNNFIITRNLTRVTFPFWGIALPIPIFFLSLLALSSLIFGFFSQTAMIWAAIAVMISICLLGLVLQTISMPGIILVNKRGISFPFMLGRGKASNKTLTWAQITQIDIFGGPEKQNKVLVIFTTDFQTIKIPVSEIEEKDIEPLMNALELWAGAEKMQNKAIEFKDQTSAYLGSFTAMWEEELARRFLPTAFNPLPAGRALRKGSLIVSRQIATGGLSAIYLCLENNNKQVVLKEAVLPNSVEDETRLKAKEMFEREAKLLARVDHPGVVKVCDYFIEDSRHYLVLDYLNGQDLRQLVLQNGPRQEYKVIVMAKQICAVMKYLHTQNPCILHRDLTPDNMVMTNDGSVVIIDFGAANEFLGTATGTLVGKQAYISPEQFRGKACVQSDIYSFGCTLYFLLTGKDPEPLSQSHPKELNEHVSEEMDALVAKCTDMEASSRFESFDQIQESSIFYSKTV